MHFCLLAIYKMYILLKLLFDKKNNSKTLSIKTKLLLLLRLLLSNCLKLIYILVKL